MEWSPMRSPAMMIEAFSTLKGLGPGLPELHTVHDLDDRDMGRHLARCGAHL